MNYSVTQQKCVLSPRNGRPQLFVYCACAAKSFIDAAPPTHGILSQIGEISVETAMQH